MFVTSANYRLTFLSECLRIRNSLPFEIAFHSKWLRNNPRDLDQVWGDKIASQSLAGGAEIAGENILGRRHARKRIRIFCLLWGGVHKSSSVRKCRVKHIQL